MKTNQKLGKLPKREDVKARTLHLSKYLTGKLPTVPSKVDWTSALPNPLPVYLNDTLGDCVIAAMAHMIGQWSFYITGSPVTYSDADIVSMYSAIGGYDPNALLNPDGSNPTDNGCDMLTALKYWRNTGFAGGHKITAFLAIDWATQAKLAAYLFGNVFTGVALPLSAQGAADWSLMNGGSPAAGSWGGHCIPMTFSSPKTDVVISWGERVPAGPSFMQTYVDEAYAVLSQDWIATAKAQAPNGIDWTQLESDLAAI